MKFSEEQIRGLVELKDELAEKIRKCDEEIEKLQETVAEKLGYQLLDHKLELYGIKKKK